MLRAALSPPQEPIKVAKDSAKQIELLKKLLGAKYKLILSYIHYADCLRDLSRDGLAKHFEQHVKEERANAYEISLRLTGMGEKVTVPAVTVDEVDLDCPIATIKKLLELEKEGVALWQELYSITKSDAVMNALAQEGARLDQQHADDMARYIKEVA
jgi:ferritin